MDRLFPLLVAGALALAACGDDDDGPARALTCPARLAAPTAAELRLDGKVKRRPALGPGVAAIEICAPGVNTRRRFTGAAARNLASIVSRRSGPACSLDLMNDEGAAEMLVTYADRDPQRLRLVQGEDCGDVLLLGDGDPAVVQGVSGEVLTDTVGATGTSGRRRAPDLLGRSGAEVRPVAGIELSSGGLVDVPGVPAGDVAFQTIPPGAPASDALLTYYVAQGPVAACGRGSLELRRSGGVHTAKGGEVTVDLGVRSTGPACRISGPISVTGLDASGRRVTRTVRTRGSLETVPPEAAGGATPFTIMVHSEACRDAAVVPATWRVDIPGAGALRIGYRPGAERLTVCDGRPSAVGAGIIGLS